MSTIYKLKTQIFSYIKDEVQKALYNNNYISKSDNTEINKTMYSYISLDMIIKNINLNYLDNKNYFYNIIFSLILNIQEQFYLNNEEGIFYIVEKIIQLLNYMNFNYCYKLNNSNISINMPTISEDNSIKKCIIINWCSNMDI